MRTLEGSNRIRNGLAGIVILALVIGSRAAMRKRIGAPAALGEPYVRGERGL